MWDGCGCKVEYYREGEGVGVSYFFLIRIPAMVFFWISFVPS